MHNVKQQAMSTMDGPRTHTETQATLLPLLDNPPATRASRHPSVDQLENPIPAPRQFASAFLVAMSSGPERLEALNPANTPNNATDQLRSAN